MFDSGLRSASDAAVISAIADLAREEAKTAARRVAAIGELVRRRCPDDDETAYWACDAWDAAAAEVSAALGVSSGRASADMHLSLSLRFRLPQVADLFTEGLIGYRECSKIADRTDLIQDREALERIDSALAEEARSWGVLSVYMLEKAIDALVDRVDPGAVHQTRSRARGRDIEFGAREDGAGTTTIRGRLYVTDAELLERRLMQMARGVCADDPRTMGQRRSDAMGALAAGSYRLACQCGTPTCPAADDDGRAGSVVIHVATDADTDAVTPDPAMSGEGLDAEDPPVAEKKTTATLTGRGGIVPTPLLAELIRGGARVRNIRRPSEEPESGYRPSAALEEFVRFRDLTCRFPNC